MTQLSTRKGMLHRLFSRNRSISDGSVSEKSHRDVLSGGMDRLGVNQSPIGI